MAKPARFKTVCNADLTYQVLTTLSEIESISGEWDSLLDKSTCNRAFSCSKWFVASTHIDQSFLTYVMVARRGSEIAGVLPLVVSPDQTLKFAGELSDYNDMIASAGDDEAAEGLLKHCLLLGKNYKRVVLNRLRLDSNCVRADMLLSKSAKPTHRYSSTTSSSFIRLSSAYEDYLATRSKNLRKGLKRAHRLAEDHDLRIRELEPEWFPPSKLPEIFLSLSRERFGSECYYKLEAPRAFVQRILPELFAERRLRAVALMKDEDVLALDVCMVGANSLCSWNGGFLAEAGRWSPGTLLIDAEIQKAFSSKLTEFDLLRGNESYKQRWINSTREIGCLEFSSHDV